MLAPETMTDHRKTVATLTTSAMTALAAGNIDLALARFEAARRLWPAEPGLLKTLATLYLRQGRWAEAWSAAETGLHLQPDDAGLQDERLTAMAAGGFVDAALTLAREWAASNADDPQAQYRLGSLLLRTGDTGGAAIALTQALAANADWPDALSAAAETAFRQGRYDDSRRMLDHAVALEPENRSLRMARATTLLNLGLWQQGLEDYEYRLQPGAQPTVERRLDLPRWQDEDLRERGLLVVAEQGIGDQLRLARDLMTLKSFCRDLVVECEPRLVPLFRRSLPGVTVRPSVDRRDGRRHVFDYGWLADCGPLHFHIETGSVMLRLCQRGLMPDRPIP